MRIKSYKLVKKVSKKVVWRAKQKIKHKNLFPFSRVFFNKLINKSLKRRFKIFFKNWFFFKYSRLSRWFLNRLKRFKRLGVIRRDFFIFPFLSTLRYRFKGYRRRIKFYRYLRFYRKSLRRTRSIRMRGIFNISSYFKTFFLNFKSSLVLNMGLFSFLFQDTLGNYFKTVSQRFLPLHGFGHFFLPYYVNSYKTLFFFRKNYYFLSFFMNFFLNVGLMFKLFATRFNYFKNALKIDDMNPLKYYFLKLNILNFFYFISVSRRAGAFKYLSNQRLKLFYFRFFKIVQKRRFMLKLKKLFNLRVLPVKFFLFKNYFLKEASKQFLLVLQTDANKKKIVANFSSFSKPIIQL